MLFVNVSSWVILAFELALIIALAIISIKNKKITLTESGWAFVPSFIILYLLYATELIFSAINGGDISVYAFINLIGSCYSVFTAAIDFESSVLVGSHALYSIAFFIGVLIALSVFIVFAVNVIRYYFYSRLKIKKILSGGCDILYGEKSAIDVYKSTYNKLVIILDKAPDKEEKKVLRAEKTIYLVCPFEVDALIKRFSKYVNNENEYNLVCFANEEQALKIISVFKSFVKNSGAENFYLNVSFENNGYKSINQAVLEDQKFTAYVNCFNKHDLIARKFVQSYPVTKFVPKDFFDTKKGIVKPNKNINVFYLGFGKINSELYEASLVNDRLVTEDEKTKKIKELFVNYYIYDREQNKDQSKNVNFFDDRYFKVDYKSGDYFDKIEKISSKKYLEFDIGRQDGGSDYQNRLLNAKEDFSNVIIAFGNDVENVDMALKTHMFLKQNGVENYHIFIRLRTHREEYADFFDTGKVTFFGFDDYILCHKVIVDEALMKIAKGVNFSYESKKKAISKWSALPAIKKLSNVYAGLNLRLKLNLLGYDLEENNGKNFNKELTENLTRELENLTPKNNAKYSDYLFFDNSDFNKAQAISYQEKLRWNAFYIVNGFAPMKIQDIDVKAVDSVIKDDNITRVHACLTTVEGLDKYHRYLATEFNKISGESMENCLILANTYCYDYSLKDVVSALNENSEYVIRER